LIFERRKFGFELPFALVLTPSFGDGLGTKLRQGAFIFFLRLPGRLPNGGKVFPAGLDIDLQQVLNLERGRLVNAARLLFPLSERKRLSGDVHINVSLCTKSELGRRGL